MLKRIVYRLYERRLLGDVREGVIPRHLGLIQDGNRRSAQEAGISKLEGYRLAAVKTEEVLSWCSELEIPSVTLWWLSTENLSRHVEDLGAVVEVIERRFMVGVVQAREKASPLKLYDPIRRST